MTKHRLLWTPKSKDRPRTVRMGNTGKVGTFTPRATLDAEHALAAQWVGRPFETWCGVDLTLTDGYVDVEVYEALDPMARKLRGDIDNYSKLVLDALNKVAYTDDKLITELHVRKQ